MALDGVIFVQREHLVDFSDCKVGLSTHGGVVFKRVIDYKGDRYILKYGERVEPRNVEQAACADSPLAEHIGSRCFEALGLPAQKTIFGTYEGRDVVACRDFVQELGDNRFDLVAFKRLERQYAGWAKRILDTPQLVNILGVFDEFPYLAGIAEQAEEAFWKMFLCDALLANCDRHAANWGYIYDRETDELVAPAPVYDCGGCLVPRLAEDEMARIALSPDEMRRRALEFPRPYLTVRGGKPTYREFFELPEAERCLRVARSFVPEMDIPAVLNAIDDAPGLSGTHQEYLRQMIVCRYETLLEPLSGRR